MKAFFSGVKEGMHRFGNNIATLVNTILLAAVYVIGVGITSIVAKIAGKRFLDMKLSKAPTYWTDLNLSKQKIDRYYRQF